jgi:hypothetical protein
MMPPCPSVVGEFLRFSNLDAEGSPTVLVLGYRITDDDKEPWSARFNAFKNKLAPSVRAGARTLARAIKTIKVGDGGRIVVVGAISSGDTNLAMDAPVRLLGAELAAVKEWEWRPDLLTKRPHRSLHRSGARAQGRREIVSGVYTAVAVGGKAGTFLVVDDFVTRGDTTADIARALREANPGWGVLAVALAKNEGTNYIPAGFENTRIPASLQQVWDTP